MAIISDKKSLQIIVLHRQDGNVLVDFAFDM